MRILVDVNLSPAWVEALRARGIDALHWRDVGGDHDETDGAAR